MGEMASGSLEYWNMRAETFGKACGKNRYAELFVEKLDLSGGESVFDMGCATGTLAIPLAQAGCQVTACDFSPKMIECLVARCAEEGVSVDAKVMAWEDDWDSFGIGENSFDVAIASRSIASQDLEACLSKLERIARERAAISVPATPVPAFDPKLCQALGRDVPRRRHDAEAFSALCERGRIPQVSYIPAPRPMGFADWGIAVFELRKLAGKEPLDERQERLFEEYAREHFERRSEDGVVRYVLDYPLTVQWAFISWDVRVSVGVE